MFSYRISWRKWKFCFFKQGRTVTSTPPPHYLDDRVGLSSFSAALLPAINLFLPDRLVWMLHAPLRGFADWRSIGGPHKHIRLYANARTDTHLNKDLKLLMQVNFIHPYSLNGDNTIPIIDQLDRASREVKARGDAGVDACFCLFLQ